jgi:hypothetical protein
VAGHRWPGLTIVSANKTHIGRCEAGCLQATALEDLGTCMLYLFDTWVAFTKQSKPQQPLHLPSIGANAMSFSKLPISAASQIAPSAWGNGLNGFGALDEEALFWPKDLPSLLGSKAIAANMPARVPLPPGDFTIPAMRAPSVAGDCPFLTRCALSRLLCSWHALS